MVHRTIIDILSMGLRSVLVMEMDLSCSTRKHFLDYFNPTATWSPWSPWTGCSVICGSGTLDRRRICNKMDPHTSCERIFDKETVDCERPGCPLANVVSVSASFIGAILLLGVMGLVAFKYRSAISGPIVRIRNKNSKVAKAEASKIFFIHHETVPIPTQEFVKLMKEKNIPTGKDEYHRLSKADNRMNVLVKSKNDGLAMNRTGSRNRQVEIIQSQGWGVS